MIAGRSTVMLAPALLLAAMPGAMGQAAPQPANPAREAPSPSVRTGVTTHFSQGWPDRLMADAARLGAVTIRDSVAWPRVEREPGRYEFTAANSGHIARACAAGMTVLLGLEPRNPLYDAGQTVWSPAGQSAFARYVRALADRWQGCVIAVEIGNEINGKGGMTGPATANRVAAHVALLKAVHSAVKPAHPEVSLLGGSVNTVATGFLSRLFAAGALDWVDGIAVHPYRSEPEGLDRELARVTAAMHRAGRLRPIWATEFSRAFPDPAAAPGWYLKAAALMESAGVSAHFWYALADQPAFPTMGLERLDSTAKPVARAFAFAARELAPLGPARRVDHGDPTLFHFRYGRDTQVIWGAARRLSAPPGARAFAADGTPIAMPARLGETPVVIRQAPAIGFGPSDILADSALGFGEPPLRWFARKADGALLPLAPVDWEWTTYLGTPALPGFAATASGIGTTATAGTLVRYTAPTGPPMRVTAALCLRPAIPRPAVHATIMSGSRTLWEAPLTGPARLAVPATLVAGEHLDLVLMPAGGAAPARIPYRLQIVRGNAPAPPC